MQLSEKEIEDLVYADLLYNDGCLLQSRGLALPFKRFQGYQKDPLVNRVHWFRQLDINPYGVIDIVGFYRHRGVLNVDLLELKAVPIETKDFNQVFRYKKGIEVFGVQTFRNVDLSVNPVLIGHGYNSGHYIQNNSDIIVSEFSYSIDGFSFQTHHRSEWSAKNDDHCDFKALVKRFFNHQQIPTNGQKVY